ncbi:MAG: hypothetical protein WB711_07695 [Terriglobales bacterium]
MKKQSFTEIEQSEITRIQQAFGISRKAAIRKMRSANKPNKKVAVAKDFKSAAANDKPEAEVASKKAKKAAAPKKLTSEEAGAARSEGLRLYRLAGRPTKAQFIRVYGKDGAKWTWEQRAKHAELVSAEEAAKKFQTMLAAKVGK